MPELLTLMKPGDLIARLIHLVHPSRQHCADCAARQAEINGWGWRGAFRRREDIARVLAHEAYLLGHSRIEPGCRVWVALLGAALIEFSRRAMPLQTRCSSSAPPGDFPPR